MSTVLQMQATATAETPGTEKASRISFRLCRNSYISVALCAQN